MPERQSLRIEHGTLRRFLAILTVVCVLLLLSCIPALNTALHLPYYRWLYSQNREVLMDELPAMLSYQEGEWYPLLSMNRSARIHKDGDFTAVRIYHSSYGDLYRHSYAFGILWTDSADTLLARNDSLSLYPLANEGWYIYALVKTQ